MRPEPVKKSVMYLHPTGKFGNHARHYETITAPPLAAAMVVGNEQGIVRVAEANGEAADLKSNAVGVVAGFM